MVTFKPSKLGCSFHKLVKDSIEAIGKLAYCAFTIFSFKNFSVKISVKKNGIKDIQLIQTGAKLFF